MTINNESLAKFEGKCWHERENQYGSMCRLCGATLNYMSPINPSYSTSPDDRERLLLYLVGKEEMWKAFDEWATEFIPWLFSPLDGAPRWVSLLSEFLGREEVKEKFGTIRCPQYTPDTDELVRGICTFIECSKRNAQCVTSGKIKAEWAKEAK